MGSLLFSENVTINPIIGSLAFAIAAYFLLWQFWNRKVNNSPPGSNGIPLLGVVLSLRANPERVMQKWSKKYGPLYMVKFCSTDVVVIGTPEVAYEAFAKNDCFNDRPQTLPVFDGNGILFVPYSDFHKEQRRFGLHTLREFGMGRRSLEPRILEIMDNLCDSVRRVSVNNGAMQPFDIVPLLYQSTANVISQIVFGHNFTTENEKLQMVVEEMVKPRKTNVLSGILMFAPLLRYLPIFSGVWKRSSEFRKNMSTEVMKEIRIHQSSYDPNCIRDYIDSFIRQIKKREKKSKEIAEEQKLDNKNKTRKERCSSSSSLDEEGSDYSKDWEALSSFTTDQIVGTVRDIFMAGTETTATTVTWIIYYLCNAPEVQQKMQLEIDNEFGENGMPSASNWDRLPYVRSVIQEVLRIRPTVPLSVPHMATKNATLSGYRIPKDAIILTNIWQIHHDEKRWPEPEKFLPERHLDENGKFIKTSDIMPFGVGARSCLGIQLAKMEVFFATVTLFRRFKLSFAPGEQINLNGESMVSLRPQVHSLVAYPR